MSASLMHTLRRRSTAALALLLLATPASSRQSSNRATLSHPSDAPRRVLAVVEISEGSSIKYELDPASDLLIVDRFLSMPVTYPANYGFLPSTLSGDGDALDVLVLTRQPVVPGAVLEVRPIALLQTLDGGERDDKVLAVPTDRVDPQMAHLRDLADVPVPHLQAIEQFYRVYKQLPTGSKTVVVEGWKDAAATHAVISAALQRFSEIASHTPNPQR